MRMNSVPDFDVTCSWSSLDFNKTSQVWRHERTIQCDQSGFMESSFCFTWNFYAHSLDFTDTMSSLHNMCWSNTTPRNLMIWAQGWLWAHSLPSSQRCSPCESCHLTGVKSVLFDSSNICVEPDWWLPSFWVSHQIWVDAWLRTVLIDVQQSDLPMDFMSLPWFQDYLDPEMVFRHGIIIDIWKNLVFFRKFLSDLLHDFLVNLHFGAHVCDMVTFLTHSLKNEPYSTSNSQLLWRHTKNIQVYIIITKQISRQSCWGCE